MKKILLPVITLFLIGLGLVSCKDSSNVKKLLFIDVTPSPTDYVFSEGDIVKEHLIVKGLYSDGSEKTLSKESYSTNLTDDKVTSTTDKVTVTYQSKTKTIPITVGRMVILNDIEVTVNTDKLYEGDNIKDYLTVEGIYSDGVKTISKESYSTNLPNDRVTTTNSVTVTYMDGSITKTKNKSFNLGDLSDYEVDFSSVVDKNDIKSILFVKNKPSDITEEGTTQGKLSYYKKGDVLYVVGDRMVLFRSNCSYMFNVFSNIEQIDFSNVNTSKVTDMKSMFYNCTNLKSVTFGDNFDTSNVTDMGFMW